ncbi:neuronal acetylcholine receptor subunit alpha-6-like [Anneissia japonica]|uniref:neuronal acetylcholine receptor subunit alpha-6-like n=1 Tax=Anneissia japonica TaxID=1529436 RepID=UPI0014255EA5|nr:neuronal acetylcholine receptor subunit alpha-6-like [Anneissia japonica]
MVHQHVRFALVGSFLLLISYQAQSNKTVDERLYEKLFTNYNNRLRPVRVASGPTTVNLTMRFRYLIDVNERHQVFSGVSWIYQIWTDPRLSWDPLEFNETTLFVVKLTQIWWPHLIYNNE